MKLDKTRAKMYNNYKYCQENIKHTPKNIQHFIEQSCSNFKNMLEMGQEIIELQAEIKKLKKIK